MRQKRTFIRALYQDGAAIVLVPLANWSVPARLLAAEFDRVIAAGFSTSWTLNHNGRGCCYVRCAHRNATGRLVSVPRIVADAGSGEVVKYRDGNRLNLRRDNLELDAGRALGREAEFLGAHRRRRASFRGDRAISTGPLAA